MSFYKNVLCRNRVKWYKYILAKRMRRKPTKAERILWIALRGNKLGVRVYKQAILFGFIVDIWIPSEKLCIEADGPIHEQRKEYDKQRDTILQKHGIKTIRFTNDEILTDIRSVLERIKKECSSEANHNAYKDVAKLEDFKDNIRSLDDFL